MSRLLHQAVQGAVHLRTDRSAVPRDDRRSARVSRGTNARGRGRVRERMREASEALDFERAAELRDALNHLEQMEEPTIVMSVEGGDRDVIGYARDGDDAVAALMRIRGGRLLAREHQFLENLEEETDGAVLEAFLVGKYLPLDDRAAELLVPFEPAERELVECSLERTTIHAPQRGPRRELVDLATQNAR